MGGEGTGRPWPLVWLVRRQVDGALSLSCARLDPNQFENNNLPMAPDKKPANRLVYSSETGYVAQRPAPSVRPGKKSRGPALPDAPKDGVVRVSRSTKGRRGKGVTLITGIPLQGDELKALARTLRQKCGSGGALKGEVVEIQGDHRDALVELLAGLGYAVKRAGG